MLSSNGTAADTRKTARKTTRKTARKTAKKTAGGCAINASRTDTTSVVLKFIKYLLKLFVYI